MNIETFISDAVRRSVEALYGELGDEQLQIQKTRREFEGDYTLVTSGEAASRPKPPRPKSANTWRPTSPRSRRST